MRTNQSDLILQKCPPSEGLKTHIGSAVKVNIYRHRQNTTFTLSWQHVLRYKKNIQLQFYK